jgi:hypothetical protein
MATDNFTGTNGDALDVYSANWTQNRGGAEILTNAYRGNTGSHYCYHWNAESFSNDQTSEVILAALSGTGVYIGPTARADTGGAETFYLFDTNVNGDSYLVKYVTGSLTTIANVSDGTRSVSDALLLDVTGTTLDPQINGTTAAMGTRTDSAISSGATGVGGYSGNTSNRGDDWEGLSLAAAAGNPWYYYAQQ